MAAVFCLFFSSEEPRFIIKSASAYWHLHCELDVLVCLCYVHICARYNIDFLVSVNDTKIVRIG